MADDSAVVDCFASLPPALALHVLLLLPVDCRLLCAAVCRSWRAALDDASLWRRLDLSAASCVSPARAVTDALLHAEMVALELGDCKRVTFDALLAVVTTNGGALRELRVRGIFTAALDTDALEALLRAAPSLAVFEADVYCRELACAHRLLRNEAPFAPLRVHTFAFEHGRTVRGEAAVLALAAELASYAHLQGLVLSHALLNTAAALDAVVDAALTRRLTSVTLIHCNLSPASTPALVRLVGGGALAELDIRGDKVALLDAPDALALGNALKTSSTITALSMRGVILWRDPAAAAALLGTLTAHPSLRSLAICGCTFPKADREDAADALGALVAANAPALTELDVSYCGLGNAGLGPLFDALPANTHLRALCCMRSQLSHAFVRERLLPAVRANTSLLKLTTWENSDDAREAEALVRHRAGAE
jgi:hypothetical protein